VENALLVGLSRQMALSRQLEVIANNVANMNTTGYKSDGALFEEFIAPTAQDDGTSRADSAVHFTNDRGIWHDFTQGPVQHTGNPLDVAIDGDGYFVVQTPNGERYTRNGAFQVNGAGQLVTADGMPVLGDNGPITFQQTDHNVAITPDGFVSVNEGNVTNVEARRGKLRLVRFARAQNLIKEGASNFRAPNGVDPEPATNAKLQQMAVEKSNVNSVLEMTRLIDITRSYAQVSALLQQTNDMRKNAISQLAEVPT